jgi:hypothetical protein
MSHIAAVRAHQIRHGGVRYIVVAGIEGIFDAPGKHAKAKLHLVDLREVSGKTWRAQLGIPVATARLLGINVPATQRGASRSIEPFTLRVCLSPPRR